MRLRRVIGQGEMSDFRTDTTPDPGVGVQYPALSITKTGELWEVGFSLTTSATVANRAISLTIRRASDFQNLATYYAKPMQPASTSRSYLWQAGAQVFFAVGDYVTFGFDTIAMPLPSGIIVTPAHQLVVVINGFQAGVPQDDLVGILFARIRFQP